MFVKLFGQILDSTVWREPNHVLRVWLTLLLVCDREGFVRMSIPGLADRAKVPLQECEEALNRLEGPDPYSQSPEQDGARIVRVGELTEPLWQIVNYERYRNLKDQDHERELWREKKARYRERRKAGGPPPVYPMSPDVHPIEEGEGEGEGNKEPPHTPRKRGERVSESAFETFWSAYPRKVGKGAARKSWARLRPSQELAKTILRAVARQVASPKWREEGGRFIPNPCTWLNQERWADEWDESPSPAAAPAYHRAIEGEA